MYTNIVLYQKIGIDYVLKYVCSTKICRVRLVLIVLSKKKKKKSWCELELKFVLISYANEVRGILYM